MRRRLSPVKRVAPNRGPGWPRTRTYNCSQASDGSEKTTLATDADLRRELRHGRQTADRVVEDRGRKPLPADLDRASRGCGNPDEAPGCLDAAADDPRPAVGS